MIRVITQLLWPCTCRVKDCHIIYPHRVHSFLVFNIFNFKLILLLCPRPDNRASSSFIAQIRTYISSRRAVSSRIMRVGPLSSLNAHIRTYISSRRVVEFQEYERRRLSAVLLHRSVLESLESVQKSILKCF